MNKQQLFPLNVYQKLGIAETEIPLDAVQTLYYLLSTFYHVSPQRDFGTSERNTDIFMLSFRDNECYDKISRKYGITSARVGQIIQRIMLRLSERKDVLILGIEEYTNKINLEKDRIIFCKSKISSRNDNELLAKVKIKDVGLSVRTFNALSRAGIKTLYDIVILESTGLKRIKNIGRHGYNEIVSKLIEYGEKAEEWRLKL